MASPVYAARPRRASVTAVHPRGFDQHPLAVGCGGRRRRRRWQREFHQIRRAGRWHPPFTLYPRFPLGVHVPRSLVLATSSPGKLGPRHLACEKTVDVLSTPSTSTLASSPRFENTGGETSRLFGCGSDSEARAHVILCMSSFMGFMFDSPCCSPIREPKIFYSTSAKTVLFFYAFRALLDRAQPRPSHPQTNSSLQGESNPRLRHTRVAVT
jgi:hypothetical protein